MNPPNIKVYIIISGLLIILFLIVTFVPFGKKSPTQKEDNFPTPTLIEGGQFPDISEPQDVEPVDFTGVAEEEIPQEIVDSASQKQSLRNQTPLDTGLFQIEFDYGEDKFIVTLAEPKTDNRSQFDQWLRDNYPGLNINQFNFR